MARTGIHQAGSDLKSLTGEAQVPEHIRARVERLAYLL